MFIFSPSGSRLSESRRTMRVTYPINVSEAYRVPFYN